MCYDHSGITGLVSTRPFVDSIEPMGMVQFGFMTKKIPFLIPFSFPGIGIVGGKDNLNRWHAIEPGRLYAPCDGSPVNWIAHQWTSTARSMRKGTAWCIVRFVQAAAWGFDRISTNILTNDCIPSNLQGQWRLSFNADLIPIVNNCKCAFFCTD